MQMRGRPLLTTSSAGSGGIVFRLSKRLFTLSTLLLFAAHKVSHGSVSKTQLGFSLTTIKVAVQETLQRVTTN